MIAGVKVAWLVAALLALAVVLGAVRVALAARARRLRGMHALGIVVLQAAAAVALHAVLFPPTTAHAGGTLTVLTTGGEADGAPGAAVVALPEAAGGGERVPDLATALRRHPDTRTLDVRGAGLTPRDLDAARGLDVRFEPPPLPRGLVALDLPSRVVVGARWSLRGRVEAVPGGRVELRDPSGALATQAALGEDGAFALDAVARAPGRILFELRVLDATGERVERIDVPLAAEPGRAARVLLLSGAPNPELRQLRRWAADAGIALDSRMQISRDLHFGAAPAFEPQALAEADLLVLDERVWTGFDPAQRRALRDAVEQGLGVLLCATGPLDDAGAAALAEFGLHVAPEPDSEEPLPVRLAGAGEDAPLLTSAPLRIEGDATATLLASDGGAPLALWRAQGRGRIAVSRLTDSFRLALEDAPAAHASLWSDLVAALARPAEATPIDTGEDRGVGIRRILCGIGAGAQVRAPSGTDTALVPDAGGCAAWWPAEAGWHRLLGGGEDIDLHVRADSGTGALDAARLRTDTLALAAQPAARAAPAQADIPRPRWPFFLLWLALAGALWGLERHARRGVGSAGQA
ncbi:carboxypeptidase regulatory-like domain-containing protein [Coralloluteibacterium thermophilus]|uniref:Carboxypeptidase regulatory-like domain-containing protein n=1 Tax=Coralloluteibacterium thermophilum TaxID=2707049 RepID=A0ABV9NKZ6_9GAMM